MMMTMMTMMTLMAMRIMMMMMKMTMATMIIMRMMVIKMMNTMMIILGMSIMMMMVTMMTKIMNPMTVMHKRFKTGNVPPGEYQFEDLSSCSNTPSSTSTNAKTRTLSRVKSPETGAILISSVPFSFGPLS